MSTSPNLIDAHCHLDLLEDFELEAERRDRRGIWTLAVTTLPQAWARNREVAGRHSMVESALGIHPELVASYPAAIDVWTSLASEARFIGEVGLDGRPRHRRSLDAQKKVFRRILEVCSAQGGKILTVHSAAAQKDALSVVEEALDLGSNKVILHWFMGSRSLCERASELGCYFSVNRAMLDNPRVHAQVAKLPRERLLTESDAPFIDSDLACQRDDETLHRLAAALDIEAPDLSRLLVANLLDLLGH